jgi:tRNA pseudouridine38-40 synthase
MPTYKLTLEYEGTRYHGWQEQKNARTVAGALRRAAEETTGPLEDLAGAGRTDTGVHALGQVAHLRVGRTFEAKELRRAINRALPADIHVLALEPAPPRFHARHAAESRAYLFQIARRRTALHRRFVWTVEEPLDLESMRRAVAAIPGRRDFVRFCDRPKHEKSTLVAVHRAEIAESGALLLLRLEATHFLWRMVCRLVGAVARVGAGQLAVGGLAALLDGAPAPASLGAVSEWTAASSGLFLERVRYPGDAPLGPLAPASGIWLGSLSQPGPR